MGRDDCVDNRHGDAAAGGIFKSLGLDSVQNLGGHAGPVDLDAAADNLAQHALAHSGGDLQVKDLFRVGAVYIAQILGNGVVEDNLSYGGVDDAGPQLPANLLLHPDLDGRVKPYAALLIGHKGLGGVAEYLASAGFVLLNHGQVVGAQHHILGGHRNRLAVGGLEQVVGGQHQEAGLRLCLGGKGNVNRHLVAVKVGVVGSTGQGMEL